MSIFPYSVRARIKSIYKLLKVVALNEHSDVVDVIVKVAKSLNVDPAIAVTIAMLESLLDPRAVGDRNMSFGLYQLNVKGELGKLTKEQAFDPETNARTALPIVHKAELKLGKFSTPGDIAAAAQRPGDRKMYANYINGFYPLVKTNLKLRGYI